MSLTYTPTEWMPGKRVTSDDLNKIEQELVKLNSEILKMHKRLAEIEETGTTVTAQNLEDLGAVMYNHQLDIDSVNIEDIPTNE